MVASFFELEDFLEVGLEGLKVGIFIVAGLKRGRREAWLRRKGACYGIPYV